MVSLLATAFTALSVKAAVDYTGSVVATDSAGVEKDLFFRGDPIYVNVGLNYQGTPYDGAITVQLVSVSDGGIVSSFNDRTDDPDIGWLNSSVSVPTRSLSTWAWFDGEFTVYDIVAYYTGGGWPEEIARTPVTVMMTGLELEPQTMNYYPGQEMTIRLLTSHTTDVFYVQIVNETGATIANWTGQVALEGRWTATWTVPTDLADGTYTVNVRDSASHIIWHSTSFGVQMYFLGVLADRGHYLPGETAHIAYVVIDFSSMTVYTGVTITYSAYWLNDSGVVSWQNGTLPGSEGVQDFAIPVDIALYSDVIVAYWANETAGSRSVQAYAWLGIGLLQADISVSPGPHTPGEEVSVQVHAYVGGDSLAGAEVDITVEQNGTVIPGYGATDLVTGLDGGVTHTLRLDQSAERGSYLVTAMISKAGHTVSRMVSFNVEWTGWLDISFDKAYYYSGDLVELTFRAFANGQEVTNASILYLILVNSQLLTTNTTTNGTASFTLPAAEYGVLIVEAIAYVEGNQLSVVNAAEVRLADMAIAAVRGEYRPLDTAVFNYQVMTNLPIASLEYSITDDYGVVVASASLPSSPNGSITYNIPAVPSESYTCRLVLTVPGGPTMVAYDNVSLSDDYQLEIVVEDSSYLSGAFRPGDTIDITYSIDEPGWPPLPLYKVAFWFSWSDSHILLTSETQGTLQVLIPTSAADGMAWIQADLYNGVTDEWLSSDQSTVTISGNADGLDNAVSQLEANITALSAELDSLIDQAAWLESQLNSTGSTLSDLWQELNTTETSIAALQTEIDLLKSELSATRASLNTTSSDIGLVIDMLDSMEGQLDGVLVDLNDTLEELSAMEEELNSMQDDIDAVDGKISDRPTTGAIAMWVVAGMVVAAVIAVAVTMVLRKKP